MSGINKRSEVEIGRDIDREVLERMNERRVTHGMSQVVFLKRENNTPTKYYDSQAPYIFLQYLNPVLRWGSKKLDITERDLKFILYLYPLGVFTTYQFNVACMTVSMLQNLKLRAFRKKNIIVTWRERDGKNPKLYCLSGRARNIIGRMHKMLVGETEMPEGWNNPMNHSGKRIDTYFMNMVKKMNKDIREQSQIRTDE